MSARTRECSPEASTPDLQWTPTPAFLLRRAALADATRHWRAGTFLECGIGTGSMTREFLERGFSGTGFDIEESNLETSRATLDRWSGSVRLTNSLASVPDESADYLWAFEVLEHIVEDREALENWSHRLKPGGKVLITVPARAHKFRADDRYAGHVRRYEKETLTGLLESCGYRDIVIRNYGFPLFNVSRLVGAWLHTRRMKRDGIEQLSQVERSVRSGVDRIDDIHRMSWLINDFFIAPFALVQRAFYRFDASDGYVATATKPGLDTDPKKSTTDTRPERS